MYKMLPFHFHVFSCTTNGKEQYNLSSSNKVLKNKSKICAKAWEGLGFVFFLPSVACNRHLKKIRTCLNYNCFILTKCAERKMFNTCDSVCGGHITK